VAKTSLAKLKPKGKGGALPLTLVHSVPAPRPGSTVEEFSGRILADWQRHYEEKGYECFDIVLERNPTAYFAGLCQLARIQKIDLTVRTPEAKPQSIEQILDRVEHETGPAGRAAFAKFLNQIKPPV
jgi:hypothetical protein